MKKQKQRGGIIVCDVLMVAIVSHLLGAPAWAVFALSWMELGISYAIQLIKYPTNPNETF